MDGVQVSQGAASLCDDGATSDPNRIVRRFFIKLRDDSGNRLNSTRLNFDLQEVAARLARLHDGRYLVDEDGSLRVEVAATADFSAVTSTLTWWRAPIVREERVNAPTDSS